MLLFDLVWVWAKEGHRIGGQVPKPLLWKLEWDQHRSEHGMKGVRGGHFILTLYSIQMDWSGCVYFSHRSSWAFCDWLLVPPPPGPSGAAVQPTEGRKPTSPSSPEAAGYPAPSWPPPQTHPAPSLFPPSPPPPLPSALGSGAGGLPEPRAHACRVGRMPSTDASLRMRPGPRVSFN